MKNSDALFAKVLVSAHLDIEQYAVVVCTRERFCLFVCLCWNFTAQSTTRSCRAGQLIVTLFLGRLRPSKRLTGTKRGRPRQ